MGKDDEERKVDASVVGIFVGIFVVAVFVVGMFIVGAFVVGTFVVGMFVAVNRFVAIEEVSPAEPICPCELCVKFPAITIVDPEEMFKFALFSKFP